MKQGEMRGRNRGRQRAASQDAGTGHGTEALGQLSDIVRILRAQTGRDFDSYKAATVLRRTERRIEMHGLAAMQEYVALLEANPQEAEALSRDLLIGVTGFFRDPAAFESLRLEVIPRLFENRRADDPVRIWHACCATGEEVYSMAILLQEHLSSGALDGKFQIFATDVDEVAVARARTGFYSESVAADVGEERLQAFFARTDGGYQVVKALRDPLVFAHHNLLRDPPFSRLDLLVCRNFLIYVDAEIQGRLVSLFHQMLKPDGFLFLGSAETVGSQSDLFAAVDRKWKIFRRRGTQRRFEGLFPVSSVRRPPAGAGRPRPAAATEPGAAELAGKALLERYAPPWVVVDEKNRVEHVSTAAKRFLEVPVGSPTRDLLKMVKGELRPALRAAIRKAFAEGKRAAFRAQKADGDLEATGLNVIAEPIAIGLQARRLALVVFEPVPEDRISESSAPSSLPADDSSKDALIRQLETQLRTSHEDLQATVEQLETSNAGLVSANEELTSLNEEHQSANEELDSSREELESLNEELVTVNNELRNKVEALDQANADMENLFTSSEIATLFLDRELRVKRFTPAASGIFHLIPSDRGRPVEHLRASIDYAGLAGDAEAVLATRTPVEREVWTRDGRQCYLIRILPYRTSEGEVEGVVATFVDLTERKRAEDELRQSEQRFRSIFETMTEGFALHEILCDEVQRPVDYRFLEINPAFERQTGLKARDLVGRTVREVLPGIESTWIERYGRVALTGEPDHFESYNGDLNRWYETNAYQTEPGRFAVVFLDVTESKEAVEGLRRYELLAGQSRDIILFLRRDDGRILEANAAATEAYGYPHEELLTLTVRDLRAPETQGLTAKQMVEADVRGILFETAHRRKDGSIFPVEVSSRGATVGGTRTLVSVVRDITERKFAEEGLRHSEERLRRAQEIAHLGSWELDLVENRLTWSDEAYRIFGLQPQEFGATYEAFLEAVHPDDRAAVDAAYSGSLREGRDTYEIEHRVVRKGTSEVRVVHEKCEHFRDESGRITRSVGMVHDVTERKRAEQALREAKEAAEAANRAKSDFLARMSHEIRTPMNGVIGMTELVLMEPYLPGKTREYLDIAKQSAKSLLDIINDILDIARIEAGRAEIGERPFDLRESLAAAASSLGVAARAKGLSLEHRVDPALPSMLAGDEGRLRQVLVNLVGNAVKFTESGHVEVEVSLARTPDGWDAGKPGPSAPGGGRSGVRPSEPFSRVAVLFAVRDSGIGIPPENLGSIFDSFSDATRSTHARFGGTGLGLSIAKQLIERMGGRIWAESEPGRGSTFRFEVEFGVPEVELAERGATLHPHQASEQPPPSGRFRILLAEDNPVNQVLGLEILKRLGHEVVAVSDGREALEILSRELFDLVLMDVQMPEVDGIEATRAIRDGRVPGCAADIPVIALTAHALKGDRERFLEAGMDDYLSKPFDAEGLGRILTRIRTGQPILRSPSV